MKRVDKIVMGSFFGLLIAYAVALLAYGAYVRREPLDQFEQQRLATHLRFAYQKYRSKQGVWPNTPEDAARAYAVEAPHLPVLLKNAREKWGVKATITADQPDRLALSFELPRPRTIVLDLQPTTK